MTVIEASALLETLVLSAGEPETEGRIHAFAAQFFQNQNNQDVPLSQFKRASHANEEAKLKTERLFFACMFAKKYQLPASPLTTQILCEGFAQIKFCEQDAYLTDLFWLSRNERIAFIHGLMKAGRVDAIADKLSLLGMDPVHNKEDRLLAVEIAHILLQQKQYYDFRALIYAYPQVPEIEEILYDAAQSDLQLLSYSPSFQGTELWLLNYPFDRDAVEEALRSWLLNHPELNEGNWVFDTLSAIDDSHVREQTTWEITAFIWLCHRRCPDAKSLRIALDQGKKVFSLRAPHLRWPVLARIAAPVQLNIEPFSSLLRGVNSEPLNTSIACLAAHLKLRGIDISPILNAGTRTFRDERDAKRLIQFLLAVDQSSCGRAVLLVRTQDKKSLMEDLAAFVRIFEFGCVEEFSQSKDSLQEMGNRILCRALALEGVDQAASKWDRTFGSSRAIQAVQVYAGKVREMGQDAIRSFSQYLVSVLNETFGQERYSLSNLHLCKVHAHLDAWRKSVDPLSLPGGERVIDTDNPYDLLLCGTEVRGSCQNVYGAPSHNKGLLGILMNGQNRLIAVVDPEGKIVARCLLRLLVDEKGQAVLFLERLYGDSQYSAVLMQQAHNKARQMGLPLTAKDFGSANVLCLGDISSLGGLAPFDYSDNSSGLNNSTFSISNVCVLQEEPR